VTTDLTTGVLSPAEANDFSSSLYLQTSSEAGAASYPAGKGGSFPGVKREDDHSPHLMPTSRKTRSCTPLPLSACVVRTGQLCITLLLHYFVHLSREVKLWSFHSAPPRHLVSLSTCGGN
jgi:hypothetical protein